MRHEGAQVNDLFHRGIHGDGAYAQEKSGPRPTRVHGPEEFASCRIDEDIGRPLCFLDAKPDRTQ